MYFGDGTGVRAASAVAPLGEGFVVVQDDATHAAWFKDESVARLRVLPPVDGFDVFEKSAGTKHLKPDLEAACAVMADGEPAVLMLGSGSSPARMRTALVLPGPQDPRVEVVDMTGLYHAVARALDVGLDVLNLEGACLVDDAFRWFHRGLPSAGLPSASVDLDPASLLEAAFGRAAPASVPVSNPRSYDLGEGAGVGLAVTDAVTLRDGAVLTSAAAEDSPNARDDGPVVATALARFHGHDVADVTPLPLVEGEVCKVEGLMVLEDRPDSARLLAVVDRDDPDTPSLAVRLRVHH